MSFVDHAAHQMFAALSVKAMASGLADNLRAMLSTPEAPSRDVFADSRMKASRLPSIDACQNSLFSQLRHREEFTAREYVEEQSCTNKLFNLLH